MVFKNNPMNGKAFLHNTLVHLNGLNYFPKSHDSIYCVALIIALVICSSFIFE